MRVENNALGAWIIEGLCNRSNTVTRRKARLCLCVVLWLVGRMELKPKALWALAVGEKL